MAITPSTDVILLKCPLELDQANQLNFANATAQYNYFYNLPKKIVGSDFVYQRKDSYIDVEGIVDEYYSYNYVMYRNDNYSNKWFYAFIEKLEFVSTDVTRIYIKTDTFQTWQFNLTYKSSFVEREHVNDDTIGAHTIPEGLELGEYQIIKHNDITMSLPGEGFNVCFCVTTLPEGCHNTVKERVKGDTGLLGGNYNSLKFFAVDTLDDANAILYKYNHGSVNADAIVSIFMIPHCCVAPYPTPLTEATYCEVNLPDVGWNDIGMHAIYNYYDGNDFQIQQPTTLAGNYTPVNNKLYTSPYSVIYMSNNVGEDIQLNWEDFPLETISNVRMPAMTMYRYIVPTMSCSAKLIFKKYKGYTSDNTTPTQMVNYGITFAKTPICAWSSDYFTNWMTQNGVNVGTSVQSSIAGMALGAGLGLATGGIGLLAAGGSVLAGFTSIYNTMAEMKKADAVPDQAHGNLSGGDMVYCLKRNSISCYMLTVRKEIAQSIDGYFSMYGYKVNTVKVPNITGRANWNYVKTIGCYILADIPQEDLQEIKNMFDNGLTIWHNPSTFRDYSQSNAIVS